jgi:hypothetical protein
VSYSRRMEQETSPSQFDARLRRLLPLLILSNIAILGVVIVIGFRFQDRWNGIYLIWGIAVAVLSAASQQLSVYVLPKMVGATKDQTDRFRQSTFRRKIVMMDLFTFGIAVGALSAIFDNVVFVLIWTVLVVLVSAVPYLLGPLIVRRVRKRQAG